MPLTYPFNFTGQPVASIPVGLDKKWIAYRNVISRADM